MIRVDVATRPPYPVRIGRGFLAEHLEGAALGRCAVLTDANVARLHASRLGSLVRAPRLVLPPGEAAKSMARLEEVLDFLAAQELERSAVLLAFGGGMVGDLGGLAAALYMRGIRWACVPTTLLAQVDAAVGGKTAVNLKAGKNLAGAFHQPLEVLADVELLATLPEEEYRSGLGEVVKTALVGDPELLRLLGRDVERVRAREAELLVEVVARCVRVKARIVAGDEREAGPRAQLNLGPTFAHAIEAAAGFGAVPHGVAVGVGLVLALRASARAGLLEEAGLEDAVAGLLARLGLPTGLAELRARYAVTLPRGGLEAALRHDKKGQAGSPHWVLVRRAGQLELQARLAETLVAELLA